MIRVGDLVFRYREGEFVLRVPELVVERGERVAVIGPSGSGKTTLLHLIAGIAVPEAGRVVTGGAELPALDDAARRDFRVRHIGLVFQEFELLEHLDVLDNILLPYRINPTLRLERAVRQRAVELARSVGIGDKLERLSGRLSHGERQRAAVCRALVTEPELLLADEPTGNLDPANKGRVLEILFDYAEQTGATLVTVTHDHDLLDRFERLVDFRQLPAADPHAEEAAQ
jgi:putative ABC transport system ATP-binding protein